MTCAEAEAQFSAYLDGTLGTLARESIEGHVAACMPCKERLDGLRDVKGWLAQFQPLDVPEGLSARIFAALASADGPEVVGGQSRQPAFVLECGETQSVFSQALEEQLSPDERTAFDAHVSGCKTCALQYRQLVAVVQLLASISPVPVPAGLEARVWQALANQGAPQSSGVGVLAAVSPPARRRPWLHAWSALAGAVASAAALFVWSLLPGVGVPRLEARAVAVAQDVAVHIQFEADERLEGVVFQVDLPEGLQFIDDGATPLLAQSVSWRGALEKGKTVVPIVVRGTRPGHYAIEAVVRKGPLLRRTTVMLPVEG